MCIDAPESTTNSLSSGDSLFPNVVVDHVSDLSSSWTPIFFLSFLFLQTDLLLELGILDDLVPSKGNLRVQHLKFWKILARNGSRGLQLGCMWKVR